MSKGQKLMFPFTKKQVDAKKLAIREAKKELKKLKKAGRWNESLALARDIVDILHMCTKMYDILRHVKVDMEALRAENSASSWYFLGYVFYWGYGGVEEYEDEEAYACWCKAAEMGHAVAWSRKATLLFDGIGAVRDENHAWRCSIKAAELGCIGEFDTIGIAYESSHSVKQNHIMAAYWYQMADGHDFPSILYEQPFRCTPWGLWNPMDMDMQIRIMKPVRDAQFSWMMVSKQLQIPKGVALMITSLICTESGWK